MIELAALFLVLLVTAVALYLSGAVRDVVALAAAVPAVAFGTLSLAAFGLLSVGITLNALNVLIASGLMLSYVIVACRWFPVRAPAGPTRTASEYRSAAFLTAATMLAGSCIALIWAGGRWIAAWPHGSADAVNIWMSRALLLSRAAGDAPARLPLIPQGHPDYPLMVPTVVAAQFGATASEALVIPQATTVVWLAAVIVAAFALAARLASPTVGCLAAAVVAANPLLARWGFTQCADVPLAYMLLLFSGALAIALTGDREAPFPLPLVGLFAGLLMWIKTEGAVVGAILLAVGAVAAWCAARDAAAVARKALAFVLGLAPPAAALAVFRAYWIRGVETPGFFPADWLDRLTDFERWQLLLTTAAYETTFYGRMRVSAVLVLAALAVAGFVLVVRRGRVLPAACMLLVPAAVAAPIYVAAYMLSPYELQWHVSTSVDRLVLQVMPTVLVALTLLLARYERSPTPGRCGAEEPT